MTIDYTVTELILSGQNLQVLPDLSLYTNLQRLDCHNNKLTRLDNLPPNLQTLYCRDNKIISLDILPPTLQELYCSKNPIYTTCKKIHGFELYVKTIEQYNKIKCIENLEKECCPMLK